MKRLCWDSHVLYQVWHHSIICVRPDQPSAEQLCISIPIKLSSVCGLNFMFNACSNAGLSVAVWTLVQCMLQHCGRLEIVSCYVSSHVAPRPAPPQALYLADCNQITRVFTWVIDPYLMPCLTHVNYHGSPDLNSPIITHVFTWAINPYLMLCPD